jgi:hypothetical protein
LLIFDRYNEGSPLQPLQRRKGQLPGFAKG